VTERNEGSGAFAGRKLNRRDFLKMGGAGLAGAALLGTAGCGGGGSGSGKIIFTMGPDLDGSIAKLINKFNKQNISKLEAVHREMPSSSTGYYDKIRTEFQAGTSDVSVIGVDVIWPKQFAPQDWIMDLSDRFPASEQKKFIAVTIQVAEYEDGIYAVPWESCPDAGLLYYRKDLLDKSGISAPPETWDDLKQMATEISQKEGIQNGFVFQGSNYEGGVCNALEYIWTHGGDVIDENDKVVIDSPEAAAGLATYASMITSGAAPEAVANWTETESSANFYNGDSVFIRYWPSLYGGFGDTATTKLKPEQIGIAPIPVDKPGDPTYSCLGGWEMAIYANTEIEDDAWKFIEFMTSEQSQKTRTIIGGYDPSRKALYNDPQVAEATPVVKLAKDVLLKNVKSRPVTEYYGDMSLEMAEQFNSALKGDISPEKAVKTLQKSLSQIMQESK
jgi:trehalose/maltose transport system substrate-binding protein